MMKMSLIPSFQTLNSISTEKNSTIIFPVPLDIIGLFANKNREKKKKEEAAKAERERSVGERVL